ncbi:hypothetical protein D3C78_1904290 [compost metagenome]
MEALGNKLVQRNLQKLLTPVLMLLRSFSHKPPPQNTKHMLSITSLMLNGYIPKYIALLGTYAL